MTEKFPNLMKTTKLQIQESQEILSRMTINKILPGYIVIKLLKLGDKKKFLKVTREKSILLKEEQS